MKPVLFLLLSSLCLIGCVSSNQVTNADQYAEINAQGREYRATITIQKDSLTEDFEGDYLSVGIDSTQWMNPESGQWRTAATAKLRRIRFTEPDTGGLEGLVYGGGPGTILLALAALGSSGHGQLADLSSDLRGTFVGLAFFGAVIGWRTGVIIGHKTDYIIDNQ